MNSEIAFLLIMVIVFALPLIVIKLGKQFLSALLPIYLIVGNVYALSFTTLLDRFQTSLAVPIYSATFLISSMLSEHFGKQDAKKAVWVGFMGQIVLVIATYFMLNSNISDSTLSAYKVAFSFLPRLILGSLTAYLISQFLDVYIFNKLRTGQKALWFRNLTATIAAQLVDTTILMYIAFWGIAPFTNHGIIWNFIMTTWCIKIFVALCDTPFLYLSKRILKVR